MHSPCQLPASSSGIGATHWRHAGYVLLRQPPPRKPERTLLQFLPRLCAIRRRAMLPGERIVRRVPSQTEPGLDEGW